MKSEFSPNLESAAQKMGLPCPQEVLEVFGGKFKSKAARAFMFSTKWTPNEVNNCWKFGIDIPILHKGGHIVLTHVNNCMCCFCGCSKWANFSCFFQYLPSPINAIFEKKMKELKNYKKIKFHCSDTSGKNIEKSKYGFLIKQIIVFICKSDFYMFSAFEVHNICFRQNFQIFVFLSIKFSSMTNVIPWPLAAEIVIKRDCVWYLWPDKDQNIYLRPCLAIRGSF